MVGPILTHQLAVKISVENYYYYVIIEMSVMQSTMVMLITMVAVVLVVASLEDLVKFIMVYMINLPFEVLCKGNIYIMVAWHNCKHIVVHISNIMVNIHMAYINCIHNDRLVVEVKGKG
jgi:hypothetical protein